MRQSNVIQEAAVKFAAIMKEAEARGAARERERYFATIGTIAGELKKLTDRMTALMLKMEAKSEAAGPRPQPKKRKADEACDYVPRRRKGANLNTVTAYLMTCPDGRATPVQIRDATGLPWSSVQVVLKDASKFIDTNGWVSLAQRKENGLDETTLPSE